ncbi:MAG: hypothetical protein JSS20_18800 [Proteobacteria bacterium]|nr:hypothetical protein [Pseudomonadota bacterium]
MSRTVAAIVDGYAERVAICLEGGDVSEAEAEEIARAEIAAEFVRVFIQRKASP